MKRWYSILLILVLVGVQVAAAQDAPPAKIEAALSDLSSEVGQTVILSDLDGYQWNEQTFGDASLGCPEPDTLYAQVVTPGYQFLLGFGGKTYDYRAAAEGDDLRLCEVTDVMLSPEATAEATAEATPEVGSGVISYDNVRFSVDPALGVSNVEAQTILATDDVEGAPYWGILPEYIQFAFNGFMEAEEAEFTPLVEVYPVSDYENVGVEEIAPEIDIMRALLEERPDFETVEDVPYLPLVNAAQVLWAQPQYLDFEGGAGVRYITFFQQSPDPIRSDRLIYTFQGLSDDGQYYISARFPVSAPSLTANPVPYDDEMDNNAYRAEVIALLNPLAEEEFMPDLTLLDNLIESLVVAGAAAAG